MRPREFLFRDLIEDMLRKGDVVLIPTQGSSMYPLIPEGSSIEVEPWAFETLRLGDVIVYRAGEALMAHRLVRKKRAGQGLRLVTKGDAISWRFKEEVVPEQVLGLVTAVWGPRGRKIRIDAGWGRILSLALAASWPFSQGVFLLLVKLKARLARFVQAPLDPKT